MAVSRNTEHKTESTFWRRVLDQLTRYDLILTVIPLVFGLAALAGVAFAIPYEFAIATGAVLCVTIIADALFVHPPVDGAGPE